MIEQLLANLLLFVSGLGIITLAVTMPGNQLNLSDDMVLIFTLIFAYCGGALAGYGGTNLISWRWRKQ